MHNLLQLCFICIKKRDKRIGKTNEQNWGKWQKHFNEETYPFYTQKTSKFREFQQIMF